MSKNYIKFKGYYNRGLWSKKMLYNVVGRKYGITKEEYKEATGDDYDEGFKENSDK